MSLRADLIEEVGDIYTDVMELLDGENLSVKLLRQSPMDRTFETLETVHGKWFFEYSEFRQNFLLQIADTDAVLDAMSQDATHVQMPAGEIYEIRRGDTVPPYGTDVTWKFFCDLFADRGVYRPL